MLTRRDFLKLTGASTVGWYVATQFGWVERAMAQIPGGTLDPAVVPKFVEPMLIPPVMPKAGRIKLQGGKNADYYKISVQQFRQKILPGSFYDSQTGEAAEGTLVWGYGGKRAQSNRGLLIHNAPSLTIEARHGRPVRVKWINELRQDPKDLTSDFLPHLLPVDPTLHWANPPGGPTGRDMRPDFSGKEYVPLDEFSDPATQYTRYTGPVPIVTHVHGAVGVGDESDGYAEAWYLPAAGGIPGYYATVGTWYDFFANKASANFGATWGPGYATFQYPNAGRPSADWYHDHTLGMTRLNVYAGPAGFYIIRGGPQGDNGVLDSRTGLKANLPGPAPREGDKWPPNKPYREIAIAIQDRSFNDDGSLFYPDTRAFFENPTQDELDEYAETNQSSPFIPDTDISPIWNPEFFGNMIMVNGNTWPYLEVEQRRYRFRFLNGCQSRFLILDFESLIDAGAEVWIIGNEGGFLATPVDLAALPSPYTKQLLMGLAERADVIVDFAGVDAGDYVLGNVGPDAPFGGFPIDPGDVAHPDSTGRIMQFRVGPARDADDSTPPQFLVLPNAPQLPSETLTRPLALLEEMSAFFPDAPAETLLGTITGDPNNEPGTWVKRLWMDDITENPEAGETEVWEFYNATGDAHPIHIHEVAFEVVNRQAITVDEGNETVEVTGPVMDPEPWETGYKDTVTAYPEQVTRVRAKFEVEGQYVWHCHIVEHEDNEMMRPYRIGPVQPGQPNARRRRRR